MLINSGSYSTIKNGFDVIFKVGTGSVKIDISNLTNINVNNDVIFFGESTKTWVTLSTGENQPVIYYDVDESVAQGTDNADSILVGSLSGDTNRIVYGNEGSDSIFSKYGKTGQLEINGGAGDDTIENNEDITTLFGGNGNDAIANSANTVVSYGNEGADTINNSGNNVTLFGGEGNDYIVNTLYYQRQHKLHINHVQNTNNVLFGDNGNDTIVNGEGDSSSVRSSYGAYSSLRGGAGNDYIVDFNGDHASINAGNGDDTLISYKGSVE